MTDHSPVQANGRLDGAHARDAADLGVFQHEHVVALFGRDGALEGRNGAFDAVAQHLAVRLQGGHAAADVARHVDERVEVRCSNGANDEHGASLRF